MKNEHKMSDGKRFLEFNLGDEAYVVELLKVREVITPPELTPIPKSPPYVCGLMNLRGIVLTVIDLRKKLGITPIKNQAESSVIIFELEENLVGAWVDTVSRVITVKEDQIKPVPDMDATVVTQNLSGVIKQQDRLALWLDVDKFISSIGHQSKKAA